MEFTPKQKIVAGLIAGLLVFGLFASTVASIFVSFSDSSGQQRGSTGSSHTSSNESHSDNSSKKNLDDLAGAPAPTEPAQAGSGEVKYADDLGFGEVAVTSSGGGEDEGQDRPRQTYVSGSDHSGCESSLKAYRDTLIELENKRWVKLSNDLESRSTSNDSAPSEPSSRQIEDQEALRKVQLEEAREENKRILDNIEVQYQAFLKQHNCK